MAKFTKVPTFHTDAGDVIAFHPIPNAPGKVVPGFSHTVIVNRERIGYLSAKSKPDTKAAAFFLDQFNGRNKPTT
jgi:hypothetical protein